MKILHNYKFLLLLTLILETNNFIFAQSEIIPLWSAAIPGAIGNNDYNEIEVFKEGSLYSTSKVITPTISIFLPKNSNGTAVVICPGGGYSHLAIDKEGFKIAKWLNTLGVTAFVLKYRLPSDVIMEDKTIGPLQDAQEAMRFIRRDAEKWHINKDKIGIMGFSAGGHLASTASTHYNDKIYASEETSARPDFSMLIYPVISMEDGITHNGSKVNLLGENPLEELIEKYSNEKHVDAKTPPTFLIHATDDGAVPVENSINYYLALKQNRVPVEMNIYENGGHGFGLGRFGTHLNWPKACENWLIANNFIPEKEI